MPIAVAAWSRFRSASTRWLGLWVWIPMETWISCECC